MNIAIIGYGKMGKMLQQIAEKRGHKVVSIIDQNNNDDFTGNAFATADVAFEFTTPHTAENNIKQAWKAGVKVVCGTTGWTQKIPNIKNCLQQEGKTLFWASNFSLGVNLFWELNRKIAKILHQFPQYKISIEEIHHIHKKDAPSGTAVTLAEKICSQTEHNGWTLSPNRQKNKIEITAIRHDDIFGIHTAKYESGEDIISFTHKAKSREGFALGAVIAAEFIEDKNGFFTMDDLLKHINI